MNRRQLLALSLLTLVTRGKAMAELPECESVERKVGGWDTYGSSLNFIITGEGLSDGRLDITSGVSIDGKFLRISSNDLPKKKYESATETELYFLSCSMFVNGKKIFYNDDRDSSVMWNLSAQDITVLSRGGQARIECDLIPCLTRENYDKAEGTYETVYDYKYQDVQKATYYFNLTNYAKAYAAAKRDHEKLVRDKKQGRCVDPVYMPCFITTATCGVVGLADDCFELTQLRKFRDNILVHMENGKAEISEYYEIAPGLVAQLGHLELLKLYWLYILPSSLMAYLRLDRLTYRHYKRMVRGLKAKYPTVL